MPRGARRSRDDAGGHVPAGGPAAGAWVPWLAEPSLMGCGELELDVVWIAELQNADAKGRQVRNLPVRYPVLIQEAHGFFERVPAAHVEAEVIEPDTILVKAVAPRRDGTQTQEQGALDQDDAAKEDRVDGVVRGVAGRWHLRRHVEAQQVRIERTGPGHVRHGQAQMMDAADRNRLGHRCLPPSLHTASPALVREAGRRARSPVLLTRLRRGCSSIPLCYSWRPAGICAAAPRRPGASVGLGRFRGVEDRRPAPAAARAAWPHPRVQGARKIGRTLRLSPGSSYNSGNIDGGLVVPEDGTIKRWQFVTG